MKTLKFILLLLFVISLATSCSSEKYDKILVRQEGTWNIDRITNEEYENGVRTLSTVDESGGIYKFNRNKEGFFILGDGFRENFTWIYGQEIEVLELTIDNSIYQFTPVEFTSDSQTLLSDLDFFGNRYVTKIELSR